MRILSIVFSRFFVFGCTAFILFPTFSLEKFARYAINMQTQGPKQETAGQIKTAIVFPDKVGTVWGPYLEWSLINSTYSGNPYDLIATVTFTHQNSGETHTTLMFYDGNNTWKFRFTATKTGIWSFITTSSDSDLNEHVGTVTINANSNQRMAGFVTNFGNKWGRTATNEAFVPQYVMVNGPQGYYNNGPQIDAEIQTFFDQHGFNGFHIMVLCRWFDITEDRCSDINNADPTPDPQTFEALELLITKVYEAGGVVHIWVWGDEERRQTLKNEWDGLNGSVDQRLQRYIAARLGPLPGWTMGYGFDLDEWVSASQLETWHDFMQSQLGWNHYLGGRPAGPNNGANHSSYVIWNMPMSYSSYEHHKPDYAVYVAALQAVSDQPVLSEDRFRIRDEEQSKDYKMDETRRGLWASTMAGGVANIWGYLIGNPYSNANAGLATSGPYPHPEQIKTYARFFENRFTKDLIRCSELTDGYCLKSPENTRYLFYKENDNSIWMNLSGLSRAQRIVAVDTKKAYVEIDLGTLSPTDQTWTAPYNSDWAIAIGDFKDSSTPVLCSNSLPNACIYFPVIFKPVP